MPDLVELTDDLPEVQLDPGDVVVREGERSGAMFVLVSGSLAVSRAGVPIAEIATPGALVGELAVLLGGDHSATVAAITPSTLRRATDGAALLRSSPDLMQEVATQVARRLQGLVAYLADLKVQYAGAPGLEMVHGVLGQLAGSAGPAAEPGSDREPHPRY